MRKAFFLSIFLHFFLVFTRKFTFWKELGCLFYKMLLHFLTSWIAKVFFEGLLYKIGPCFDTEFAQLKVMLKTSNKFVEIAAVAERYSIITHVKNKRSKKQPFRICLFCNKIYNISQQTKEYQLKNKKDSLYLVYNIIS